MRKSGITGSTPNEFLLGAGTVFKNFRYVYSKAGAENPPESGGEEALAATGSPAAPAGALRIVGDDEEEAEGTIRLWKVANPGVTFIGTKEGYRPAVGDYVTGGWDDSEEHVLGATSGGNKLTIRSELTDIEVDGVQVKVKGLTQKTGEEGSLETNLAQHTKESFLRAVIGRVSEDQLIKGFTQMQTKSLIEASDYLTDGTEIIVILENVICTSGLEVEGKNKETAVYAAKFECTADFGAGKFDTLPIYIFYPDKAE